MMMEKSSSNSKAKSLLPRIILSSSNQGDLILDPFFGSGTTGAVAKKLSRHFIGIENNEKYVNAATKRISKVASYDSETIQFTPSKKSEPRIPFGWLIERKLIEPGTILYDNKRSTKQK